MLKKTIKYSMEIIRRGVDSIQESVKFSVVICTFNNGLYIEKAIQSVLNQTYSAWEMIIIDDGSSDDTQYSLVKYHKHPSVLVIQNKKNRGKAFCLNQGLEKASGSWLIELDADDWLEDSCLERVSKYIENDKYTAMYYGWYFEWTERERDKKLFRGRVVKHELQNDIIKYLEKPVPVAPRIYNTEILVREGGWMCFTDIYKGRYFEDVYMICSLLKAGYIIKLMKETLYHRRLRKGSISDIPKAKYLMWKQYMYCKWKIKKG